MTTLGLCHDPPDQGDVSHGEEAHQDGAAHDAGVPGVVPVHQGVELVWAEPHDHLVFVLVMSEVVTPGSPRLGVTESRESLPRPSPG